MPDELPQLTPDVIQHFKKNWRDDGLWDDIILLAHQVWNAIQERDRLLTWHHLVMSVGNFKRQNGRRLRPTPLTGAIIWSPSQRAPSFHVPGSSLIIDVEESATWVKLEASLHGAATATTTTLLAALWPGRHFVFDRRVNKAANGLRLAARKPTSQLIELDTSDPLAVRLADYITVRTWVEDATDRGAGVDMQAVERSLYQLDIAVGRSKGRTWRRYQRALMEKIDSAKRGDASA